MSEPDLSMQLCIFDMSRGQNDDHELDKILFYHPTECPLPAQQSLIGLSGGLITFTKLFSPNKPCEEINSDKRRHIFFEPEEDIWMVMLLEKRKEGGDLARTNALQAILKEAHGLFVMFFGSIRSCLSKDPTGGIIRSYLRAFFPDYLSDVLIRKKILASYVQESLNERGTIQAFPLERTTALEVQTIGDLLLSSFGSGKICHAVMLFQDLLVSSSLPPEDAAHLFTYAKMRLIPDLVTATSTGKTSKKSLSGSSSSKKSNHENPSAPTPRPMQRDKWLRDQDGFLGSDAWGSPTIYIQPLLTEKKMQLYAYQHKQLTVLMLINISATHVTSDSEGFRLFRGLVHENSQRLITLEERISREWGGLNANHVAGYRYLYTDNDRKWSKSSPANKIATLAKDSLLSLDKVRAEIDATKARSERKEAAQPYDLETCVRTRSNAWIVVRVRGGNELYLLLERASETLLLTSDATERFSRRFCEGVFNSD